MEIKAAIGAFFMLVCWVMAIVACADPSWLLPKKTDVAVKHKMGLWRECSYGSALPEKQCHSIEARIAMYPASTQDCIKKALPGLRAARAFYIIGIILGFLAMCVAGFAAVNPSAGVPAAALCLITFLFVMIGWDIGTAIMNTTYCAVENPPGASFKAAHGAYGAAFGCGIVSWIVSPIAMALCCMVRGGGGGNAGGLTSLDQL
eukprot:TRINITY_DN67825_c5_g4_i1.p1 TRINITY_DN67825_c5_g4~~TRINITY_DN67825_c5_g4_i1.p1  ORF type:complete len:212 (-),score=7.81 TRINITY_DN67825_c5_g4_i1:433-1044(-)